MDALKHIITFDKLVNADHWSSVRSGALHTYVQGTYSWARDLEEYCPSIQKNVRSALAVTRSDIRMDDIVVSADTALTLTYDDRTSFTEMKMSPE